MRRARSWELLLPWLGVFFLTLPFYRIIYFSDRALYYRDLIRDLLVQKSIWAEAVRHGEGIPYWNHFALGGTPFLAMNVGAPLHPLNALFLFFPQSEIGRALSLYLFSHYVLFYWGAYLLLRRLGTSRLVGTLAASAGAMSGYLVSAHSLGHVLASSVAVPWSLLFLLKYKQAGRLSFFLLAGAAVAWPIYAGDPQFSLVLAVISVVWLSFQKKSILRKLSEVIAFGLLSLMAAAAQLLPTLELALSSARNEQSLSEIMQFSFHPIRLAETFFPLFFGNRIGNEEFWAENLVNFPYKNPFIFSTYPGAMILFGFFYFISAPRLRQRTSGELALLLCIPFGFILAFGIFSFIPLYEILLNLIPAFKIFRYPERLLFWPTFAIWLLASLSINEILNSLSMPMRPIFRLILGIFLATSLLGIMATYCKWVAVPAFALHGLLSTAGSLALLWAALEFSVPKRPYFLFALLLLHPLDLFFHQSALVWDQSKYTADGKRYRLVNELKADLDKRQEEIRHGASFRFSSERLPAYMYSAASMDHAVFTTFNCLENLAPNTAGLFGIEDISGYFSLLSKERNKFSEFAVRGQAGALDLRFYYDLMSVNYLPSRDANQQIVLTKNSSAQPYLFSPEHLFAAKSFDEALNLLRNDKFRSNRDAIVEWDLPASEQEFKAGNFLIQSRTGREINFDYFPGSSAEKLILINEGFDPHWRAQINGKNTEIFRVNAWAMGILPKNTKSGESLNITFQYRNPWIYLGFFLTALWLMALLLQLAREYYYQRSFRNREILS
ncbi:MAG: hypothetical protein ACXWQO_00170 [Bdellovibrionota bacterium]